MTPLFIPASLTAQDKCIATDVDRRGPGLDE
jgi:hypothetical protein